MREKKLLRRTFFFPPPRGLPSPSDMSTHHLDPHDGDDAPASARRSRLIQQDRAHVWHPFTPMRQWCEADPLVIERGDGVRLYDTDGRAYFDGVSSLWCNVHGHRVPAIDRAVRDQLDRVAHTTLLGLASPPSVTLAARLSCLTRRRLETAPDVHQPLTARAVPPGDCALLAAPTLHKTFYTDAGATALEVAFKMAVGHWHHRGQPKKTRFIGLAGAYHGDTNAAMSIGYSDLFHRAFRSMVFDVDWFPAPDAVRPPEGFTRDRIARACHADPLAWPSEDPDLGRALADHCLDRLEHLLGHQADRTAAVVIEPVMQGAAGMVCQPPGFVRRVAELAKKHGVLLIADEVAVGFGRTGAVFACEHDRVVPDILCLAKGLTAGYLPLAVTLTTDTIYESFCGTPDEKKTLYHGHTYTGNPLACAAALAGLDLFESPTHGSDDLIAHTQKSAQLIRKHLHPLRHAKNVRDVRQRGLMVGIELCKNRHGGPNGKGGPEPFDFSKRTGAAVCTALRAKGIIIRPLGDILVLMPIPATPRDELTRFVDTVVETVLNWPG